MLTELPVQVDGEPWLQPPGQVVVLRSALKVIIMEQLSDSSMSGSSSYCGVELVPWSHGQFAGGLALSRSTKLTYVGPS